MIFRWEKENKTHLGQIHDTLFHAHMTFVELVYKYDQLINYNNEMFSQLAIVN